MGELVILRGPSATGKSTIAQQYVDAGYHRANKDTLRLQFPNASEKEIHGRIMQIHDAAVRNGASIVNDNVNFSSKTINGYVQWAQKNNYSVKIENVGADVPLEEAIRRDSLRAAKVGKSVITQQYIDFGYYRRVKPYTPDTVLFDIDGTLANIAHRQHHVMDDRKDWKLFFADMLHDVPNVPVVDSLLAHKAAGKTIILLSGRPSNYRAQTEAWLDKYAIPFDLLLMRPYNDSRQDDLVKYELYNRYIYPYFNVSCVYDDRDQVVAMWRTMGLMCFQVNYGNF